VLRVLLIRNGKWRKVLRGYGEAPLAVPMRWAGHFRREESMANTDTKLALRVLARIQQHDSRSPIMYDSLAAEFQISWRKVASIVEELRDAGHKIGSSNSEPHGCFLARTPEELSPTITRMKDQAKKILARTNRMADWNSMNPTIFEQQETIPA
jgi:biotin operon repressor